jgi:site-specific DNA-methyltransferase (adenine-specific)
MKIINNKYNSDILGFISNLSSDEVFTPPRIANKILDLLPKHLWSNEKVTFFDPASKSGVFLR